MTVIDPKTQQALANGTSKPNARLDEDDLAVLALRNFIFDICNQNGGGHGGSAIGMAAIGVALYKYVMRYNPSNPEWFDRDRFVLSNGMYPFIALKAGSMLTLRSRAHCHVPICTEPSHWLRRFHHG